MKELVKRVLGVEAKEPKLEKATRQIARRKIYEKAMHDIAEEYPGMPRRDRKEVASSLAKAMWGAVSESRAGKV